MSEAEDRLQEQLEALEAGTPLNNVLTSASEEDAGLLRLMGAMRGVAHPVPSRDAVQVVEHARQRTEPPARPGHRESRRLLPGLTRENRLVTAGLFVVLIGLLAGAALLIAQPSGSNPIAGPGNATAPPSPSSTTETPQVEEASPQPAPAAGKLAFVRGGELWVVSPGGEAQQVTDGQPARNPRWSPSGEWLAYQSIDNSLWLVGAGDTEPVQIEAAVQGFAWSPLVDRLAYAVDNDLWTFGMNEAEPSRLVSEREFHRIDDVIWSPDGEWIAYRLTEQADQQTITVGINKIQWNGQMMDVLDVQGADLLESISALAGWSDDGDSILFWRGYDIPSASLTADGLPLYRLPVGGGEPQELAATLLYRDYVRPQPMGSELAVIDGPGRQVWENKALTLFGADGSSTVVTPDGLAAGSPAWSRDGQQIVYAAMPEWTGEAAGPDAQRALMMGRGLWLYDVAAGQPRQLTGDDNYRDEYPQWSADGRSLLFVRLDAESHTSVQWMILADESIEPLVDGPDLPASTGDFGYYGYIDWSQVLDWLPGAGTSTPEAPADGDIAIEGPLPGWQWYEDETHGYTIAYPQVWDVRPNAYGEGQTIFQSPETNTEVQVFVRGMAGDWLEHVRANWPQLMLSEPPDDLAGITPNIEYRGREALIECQPSTVSRGPEAALVFPEGDNLIAIYLHGAQDADATLLQGLEGEMSIYQTMLESFSPEAERGEMQDLHIDCESYKNTGQIHGTVQAVDPDMGVIVLDQPAHGFVTVTLAPQGALVDADGQLVGWRDVFPGLSFEVEGMGGEAGNYAATLITLQMVSQSESMGDAPEASPTPTAQAVTPPAGALAARVTGDPTLLRAGPSIDYDPLADMTPGTELIVLGKHETYPWLLVTWEGQPFMLYRELGGYKQAWVYQELVQLQGGTLADVPVTDQTGEILAYDPVSGIPADVTAWDMFELPYTDASISIPIPPGWEVVEWPASDDLTFSASLSIQPPLWEDAAECGYQCPEIGVTVWSDPQPGLLRAWLRTHSTTEPFGTVVADDAEILYFGVQNVEETTLGVVSALGFTHDVMGMRVYTVLAGVDGGIVSLSKTHVGQFEFEPVFGMMRVHTRIWPPWLS